MAPSLLHHRLVVLLAASATASAAGALASGCVLPLQFEEEKDAGVDDNSPPVIVTSVPPMPGFTTIERDLVPAEIYTVDVRDKNLDDTIYLRVFRAYQTDNPVPPLTDKQAQPGGLDTRRVEMTTAAWCVNTTPGTQLAFDVIVADRPFLDPEVPPAYQALPAGAESSTRTWVITCE